MPHPAGFVMELADSEIRTAYWRGPDVHLAFSAVAATRSTLSGVALPGYLLGVELVVRQMAPVSLDALSGRLRGGWVRVGGGLALHRFAVPVCWSQAVILELEPAQAGFLVLQGQGLDCRLQDGGHFRESMFC